MLKGLLGGVYHELKTLKTINKVHWPYYASVNSKHQHPPPPRVLHSTAALGPGFILDDLPRGPAFYISIKLRSVQWKSILSLNWHLDHTSMRFIGSSDFNIKTIRTFGLKAYTCTSTRRSIYIVMVTEGITPFRLSP